MYECFGISEETGEVLDNMLCKLFAPLLGVTPESLSDKALFGQDNENDTEPQSTADDNNYVSDEEFQTKETKEPRFRSLDGNAVNNKEIRIEETGCRSLMSRVII